MFVITQRQYEIIMTHLQENYPFEAGGILAGMGNNIKGVMPIVNQSTGDARKLFGVTSDDLARGHQFAKKHSLQFMGFYHSHPQGDAYPSDQDLNNNQKYLFIISLRDRYNPEFMAYEIINKTPIPIPIQIVDNRGVTVVDIETGKPKLSDNVVQEEMDKLSRLIDDIIDQKVKYPKMKPSNKYDSASFNTLA